MILKTQCWEKENCILVVMALGDREGIIIKATFQNASPVNSFAWAYGGASGKKFIRDGDMGPDPESSFYLKPEYCTDNNYTLDQNKFLLRYGTGVVAEADPYVNKNLPADTVMAGKAAKEQQLTGFVPTGYAVYALQMPYNNKRPAPCSPRAKSASPAIAAGLIIKNDQTYFFAVVQKAGATIPYAFQTYSEAEAARKEIADRIKIETPDPYINTHWRCAWHGCRCNLGISNLSPRFYWLAHAAEWLAWALCRRCAWLA